MEQKQLRGRPAVGRGDDGRTRMDELDLPVMPGIGMTVREAMNELAAARGELTGRDLRVCACGHPVNRHTEIDVYGDGAKIALQCQTPRLTCPCKDLKPVLEVKDTRPFLHKTKGVGKSHALILGISSVQTRRRRILSGEEATTATGRPRQLNEITWLEGWPRCEGPENGLEDECDDGGQLAYCVDQRVGRILPEQAELSFLLCRTHFLEAKVHGFGFGMGARDE